MPILRERLLRGLIRHFLKEDVYSGGKFSPESLEKSIMSYTSGGLTSMGVRPEAAKEVTLDDLRVAFGELGYDMYASLQAAVSDGDRSTAASVVRNILSSEFIDSLSSLDLFSEINARNLDDILLPGDVDDLVNLIVDDMFDGDGMVTTH